MTKEKLIHHLAHVREKHALLDKQIDSMETTGNFEDLDLVQLKKKRLVLRDEMEGLLLKIKTFDIQHNS